MQMRMIHCLASAFSNVKSEVTIQHICVFGKPSRGLSEKAFHASRRVNQGSRFTNLGKTLAFQNESW